MSFAVDYATANAILSVTCRRASVATDLTWLSGTFKYAVLALVTAVAWALGSVAFSGLTPGACDYSGWPPYVYRSNLSRPKTTDGSSFSI